MYCFSLLVDFKAFCSSYVRIEYWGQQQNLRVMDQHHTNFLPSLPYVVVTPNANSSFVRNGTDSVHASRAPVGP